MGLVCDVSQNLALEKDGTYQHDIVEVGPRDVRVVHDVHLAFSGLNAFPPQVGEGVPQPGAELPYVYRALLRLPHRPLLRVEYRTAVVGPLPDVRREGRLPQGDTHLLRYVNEAVLHDFDRREVRPHPHQTLSMTRHRKWFFTHPHPGGTTTVESYSSTIAGPRILPPTGRSSRESTRVSNHLSPISALLRPSPPATFSSH